MMSTQADGASLARTLWRQSAYGFALALALIAAPVGVRLVFGVSSVGAWGLGETLFELACVAAMLLATTAAVAAAMRRGASWRAMLAVALGTSAVMTVLAYLACLALARVAPGLQVFEAGEPRTVAYGFLAGVADAGLFCALWSMVVLLPTLARAEQARRAQAEALLRESELLRLRTALAPHFVLNTLNAIAGLVTESPADARRLLGDLGDLLRELSDPSDEPRTLRDEIAWIRRYAALLEARHGEMLRFAVDVSPEAESPAVPRFVLQPLVENAAQHGALRNRGGGTVTVRARREPGALVIEVRDDGPAPTRASRPGGQGTEIVRRRIALAHPAAHFALLREGDETVARVRLPLAEAA